MSSIPVAGLRSPVLVCDTSRTPARAAAVPDNTNAVRRVLLTLTPAGLAASAFPPDA